MKKTSIYFSLFAITAIIMLLISGCASIFYSVTIRTDGNISSALAGSSINLRSSGRNVIWAISSTSDGSGQVANGTFITQNGMLTIDPNESSSVIYVFARSERDGFSDIRQIRIVTVTGVTIIPASQVVVIGRTLQLRSQVTGTNNPDHAVTWAVSSNAAGTGSVTQGTNINANGLLTVASSESLRTLHIIATSRVDPSKSASVQVAVVVPTVTSVTVTPVNQTLRLGQTLQLNASVIGTHDPDNTVTWSVSSNATGTGVVTAGTSVNARGLLTVAPNESLSTLHITATSVYDPTKSGRITVNVIIPTVTSVAVSPSNQSITAGNSFQFTASVTGTNNPNTAVTWVVSSNAAGSGVVQSGTRIDSNGLLTIAANETARNLFVFAISVFDPGKSGSVSVNIIPAPAPTVPTPTVPTPAPAVPTPPAPTPSRPTTPTPPTGGATVTGVTINPAAIVTQTNRTVQFNAVVTGTNNPNTAVRWSVTGGGAPRTTINANGLLTVAPNEWATTLTVTATSVADPSRSSSAIVTISNNNPNQGPNQGR